MTSSANETQVGGQHYKGKTYQHWDFVAEARLPYLEGVITKYVDRHPRKHGREDLEKARHYAEKLRECAVDGVVFPVGASYSAGPLERYFNDRPEMPIEDKEIIHYAVNWTSSAQLDILISALNRRIIEVYGQ